MTPIELLKQHYSAEGQRRIRQARVDGAVLDRMVDKALTEIKVMEYEGLIRVDTILFGPPQIAVDFGIESSSVVLMWHYAKSGIISIREVTSAELYAPAF